MLGILSCHHALLICPCKPWNVLGCEEKSAAHAGKTGRPRLRMSGSPTEHDQTLTETLVERTIVVADVEQGTHGAASHVCLEPTHTLLHVLLWR